MMIRLLLGPDRSIAAYYQRRFECCATGGDALPRNVL
jgi:hypothetical protein